VFQLASRRLFSNPNFRLTLATFPAPTTTQRHHQQQQQQHTHSPAAKKGRRLVKQLAGSLPPVWTCELILIISRPFCAAPAFLYILLSFYIYALAPEMMKKREISASGPARRNISLWAKKSRGKAAAGIYAFSTMELGFSIVNCERSFPVKSFQKSLIFLITSSFSKSQQHKYNLSQKCFSRSLQFLPIYKLQIMFYSL